MYFNSFDINQLIVLNLLLLHTMIILRSHSLPASKEQFDDNMKDITFVISFNNQEEQIKLNYDNQCYTSSDKIEKVVCCTNTIIMEALVLRSKT